jgi:Beta/Gamma crystallin
MSREACQHVTFGQLWTKIEPGLSEDDQMKKDVARVIAVVVAVLALAVGVSVAQPRHRGEVGITVYNDVNFQGATATFRKDVPDLREFTLNDSISSLDVAPGESWEVCENVNYRGRCFVVSGSQRDLRTSGWNDIITSMRRVPSREGPGDRDVRESRDDRGGVGIRVYDDVNFQGAPAIFEHDVPNLRDFRLNDRISSLEVALGESWEVCEKIDYGGRCVVVSGAERDLRTRGWNDIISSMRRVPDREGRR